MENNENNFYQNQERERELQAEKNRLIRQKRREERKKLKEKRVKDGLIAGVITLSVITLMLSGFLTYAMLGGKNNIESGNVSDERSFYELVSYVDGMDVNLSKLVVSKDDEKRQKILGDVRVQSSLATESLSNLSIKDEDKFYTVKFINQVNDFSKYLAEKLIDGESLSSSDINTLKSIRDINKTLKENLIELVNSMGGDKEFSSLLKDDGEIITMFKDLETLSTEYPHMIYDGAFSEGAQNKTAKAIENLQEITKTQAEETFIKCFSDYRIKDVSVVGEGLGRAIETFNLEGVDDSGVMLSAQITKKGGKLVEFNYFKECSKDNLDLKTSQEVALNFLEKIGYKNMKAVWTADSGNTVTINFASTFSGVICYSDLIKVNVCRERGIVSGIEASSYIYNNAYRAVKTPQISLKTAKDKVASEIEIESSRLAIIPKGIGSEVLAYEFYGKSEGEYYYIYIDAMTGKEQDVFKVISGSEGELLA